MKFLHRPASVLCILLLVSLLLAACAREGGETAESTRAPYTGNRTDLWDEEKNPPFTGSITPFDPDSPDPDEPEQPEPENPGQPEETPDYGDASFCVLACSELNEEDWTVNSSASSANLEQMLYARNLAVEEQLNLHFEISMAGRTALPEKLLAGVLAKQVSYHVVSAPLIVASMLTAEDLYADLHDLPLMLDQSWWNQSFIESAEINGRLPMATGAISPSLYRSAYVMYYNQDFFTNPSELYDMVERGDWTMEALAAYCAEFSYNGGALAVIGLESAVPKAFRNGMDVDLTYRDAEGLVTARSNLELEERWTHSMDWMRGIWDAEAAVSYPTTEETMENFQYSPAAFMVGTLSEIEELTRSGAAFGLLPMPKLDAGQQHYRTGAVSAHGTVAVPAYRSLPAEDAEMIAFVLDVLSAANQQSVLPICFLSWGTREEDADLMNSLDQMLRWDFVDVYCYTFGLTFWDVAFYSQNSVHSAYMSYLMDMENKLFTLQE